MDSPKDIRGELIRQLQKAPGWKIVIEEANAMMRETHNRLLKVEPTNTEEVARLQERHKTIERFMNIINGIAKEV